MNSELWPKKSISAHYRAVRLKNDDPEIRTHEVKEKKLRQIENQLGD